MDYKEIEKLDAFISGIRKQRKAVTLPSLPGRECLPEEVLEDYLDRRLSKDITEALESHLAGCRICLDRLLILKAFRLEGHVSVPQRLINKARDLVQETRPNCLELILGFAKDTIRIIRNSGILLSPELIMEPVRGKQDTQVRKATDYVAVKKLFGNITVDVQIERINGSFKLMINTRDLQTSLSPPNMRLALFSMDRELNSVDDSEAVFYIKLKKYIVKIIQEDFEIGSVRLDLRQEQ
ncbi:zf-HC2 domain-containing protein [bacterium]|nr:zf-HC2 domain-containing protein [bacterium]